MTHRAPMHEHGHRGGEHANDLRQWQGAQERDKRIKREARRLSALPDDMRWQALQEARKHVNANDHGASSAAQLIVAAMAFLHMPLSMRRDE